jgi:hypothetical protein
MSLKGRHAPPEQFPDHSSFSVLREPPMAFFCSDFKKLNLFRAFVAPQRFFADG